MSQEPETAILAGGCFWGMQDLIRKLDGVISTRVGYTGGDVANATYRNHGNHAEAIEIIFDPGRLSYRDLLEFFFQVHDPTTKNRQGNDIGASYRSAIFYTDDTQKRIAEDTIADVEASGLWPGRVVTEVSPVGPFWEAEPEHQDYLERYPDGYTCHFVRPGWKLPHRADAADRQSRISVVTEVPSQPQEDTVSVTTSAPMTSAAAIRPFTIEIAQAEIDALRARLAATRWPDKETVDDRSQGVQLAKLRPLVDYWGTGYDWRKVEARLNTLPQFMTQIDGLNIQFAHIRSSHDDALPLLMTHGWPGSIIEFLKVIEPLTNPTAHGGSAEDAFHLVLPTMPGYGFSGIPTSTGWNPGHMARAFDELMLRLGYQRYVSQGGDWGAIISQLLAVQAPAGLVGIHVNMPGTVPPDVLRHLRNFDPAPAALSWSEKIAYHRLLHFYRDGFGYAAMMNQSPQTIGYALADSPVAMAAYYYDKFAEWTDSGGQPEGVLTYDEMLDAISLYWLTNTGTSSSRSYWEGAQAGGGPFDAFDIPTVPVAVTVFPAEIYPAPRSWAEKAFGNLIYWNEADKGGHFASWEQPELFTQELRAAFRPLR